MIAKAVFGLFLTRNIGQNGRVVDVKILTRILSIFQPWKENVTIFQCYILLPLEIFFNVISLWLFLVSYDCVGGSFLQLFHALSLEPWCGFWLPFRWDIYKVPAARVYKATSKARRLVRWNAILHVSKLWRRSHCVVLSRRNVLQRLHINGRWAPRKILLFKHFAIVVIFFKHVIIIIIHARGLEKILVYNYPVVVVSVQYSIWFSGLFFVCLWCSNLL